ncbi:MAG: hypothetical protein M3530_00420 [Thermoproteota archaeon]|nr:hypothetical protein [Thermoproteota archaeon]
MSEVDPHSQNDHLDNGDSHDDEETETVKPMKLNEVFAIEMQRAGINAEAIPIGSLHLEKEEYYNSDLGSRPHIVTNKGCIKLKSCTIDLVQIIQRN